MSPHLILRVLASTLCLCFALRAGQAQQPLLAGSVAVDVHGVRHKEDDRSSKPPVWMVDLIKHVPPEYSYDARRAHLEGAGLFRLELDVGTGRVSKASVLKSTGVTVLDNSALWALRRWRFTPGRWKEIDAPITFSMLPPAPQYLPRATAVKPKTTNR
jgi:TonB family protein